MQTEIVIIQPETWSLSLSACRITENNLKIYTENIPFEMYGLYLKIYDNFWH